MARKPNRAAEHLVVLERRQNLRLERQRRNREDELSIEASFKETQDLAKARGEVVNRPAVKRGEGRKPMRRVSGLEWLFTRERITEVEFRAGVRYGEVCGLAASGDFGSCVGERSGGSTFGPKSPGSVKLDALFTKSSADKAVCSVLPADMGQRIIDLLERVCGASATVREIAEGDRAAAERMESELRFGLNLLAVHFRISSSLTNGAKSHDQSGSERVCA